MSAILDGVLYGADDEVAAFVAARLPRRPIFAVGTPALGVIRHGALVGGAVFHDWQGHDIQVSCAVDNPRWAKPQVLRRLFWYPFRELGCVRMTALTAASNVKTQRFLRNLGFKPEGVHPLGFDGREDLHSLGLLASDCRWIKD